MAAQPFPILQRSSLPDYLPARMVNEFVYCPRLFFYEWVEGLFQESADTVEGSVQHGRVDKEGKGLPPAEELPDDLRTEAVTLSSGNLASMTNTRLSGMNTQQSGRVRFESVCWNA